MAKTISTKKVIATEQPQPIKPDTNYIGERFEKDGRTYVIWKYTQPLNPTEPGEYDAVALVDPSKGIETVSYTHIERTVKGKKESTPLNRLENVDPSTHFSLPANQVKRILLDPSLLVLKSKRIIKPVKAA